MMERIPSDRERGFTDRRERICTVKGGNIAEVEEDRICIVEGREFTVMDLRLWRERICKVGGGTLQC